MKRNKPASVIDHQLLPSQHFPMVTFITGNQRDAKSLHLNLMLHNAPFMSLSFSAIAELHWWLKYLKNASKSLQDIQADCTIQTDASEQGQGATGGNSLIGGRWSPLERNHINVMELKTVLLALKLCFRHNCNVKYGHILTDNSTDACILFFLMILQDVCGNLHFIELSEFLQATFLVQGTQWQTKCLRPSVTKQNEFSPTNF